MKLKDKKVLVFGAGKSGISAARLLQKLEAYVVLYDGKKDVDTGTFKDKIDTSKNWEAYFGEFPWIN